MFNIALLTPSATGLVFSLKTCVGVGGCGSVAEHVLSMYEALGWIPSTKQCKDKNKKTCLRDIDTHNGSVQWLLFLSEDVMALFNHFPH